MHNVMYCWTDNGLLIPFSHSCVCVCVCVCMWAQLCLTFFNPVDYSPPGSSVHAISWARIWSGLSFPSPGDLPDPGIKPLFPAPVGGFFTTEPPGNPHFVIVNRILEWHMRKITTSFWK